MQNTGKQRGRPVGSKKPRLIVSDKTKEAALNALIAAVDRGEPWAVLAVLDRFMPSPSKLGRDLE